MKLFITDVNLFDDTFFEKAEYVPAEKKTDLMSFQNPMAKKEHILAWSVLSYAYESETGGKREAIRLAYSRNGKPFLRSGLFFFNLSHSYGKVICAVSESEVGADVQQIKPVKPAVVKRVLCENEQKALAEADNGRDSIFMRFWTEKESYRKLTGEGISAGLSDLDFSSGVGKERFRLFSKEFLTFEKDGFVYSVCFDGKREESVELTRQDFACLAAASDAD